MQDFRQKLNPLLIAGAGLLAYHNSFGGPFIFDDKPAIVDNPHIRNLWPIWRSMSWPAASAVAGRPVVCLSLALNYSLGGLNVWGYHAFNLLVHLLSAMLLFGITRRTLLSGRFRGCYGEKESAWLAAAVVLIWAVHPLLTESVNYVVQRTELLFGLFMLLTLYCVIRGEMAVHRGWWHTGAVAACTLGMASKETMAVAPVIVVLYDRVFLATSLREVFRRRWVLYVGLAATWAVAGVLLATSPRSGSAGFGLSITPWDYAKTQCGVIVHYLRLALWPHPLALDYSDWPVARTLGAVWVAAVAVGLLLAATLWTVLRGLPVGFLGAWFFLVLAPSSSFLPIVTEIAAERRMYLPLAAVVACVVLAAHTLLGKTFSRSGLPQNLRHAVEITLLIAAVSALGWGTILRNEDYRSEYAIWSDTVAKRPNNARAHNNLGVVLEKQGRVMEAADRYREALRLNPNSAKAHNNLGLVLAKQGDIQQALKYFFKALSLNPYDEETHNNLGVILANQGSLTEAVTRYSAALQIKPHYAEAHFNLGVALAAQGRVPESMRHYQEALRFKPDYLEAHTNLGVMFHRQGCVEKAVAHFREALRINPNDADTHYNLGVIFADQGKADTAINHYRRAAAAYANAGQFDAAAQAAEKALELAVASGKQSVAEEIRRHMESYRTGKPVR